MALFKRKEKQEELNHEPETADQALSESLIDPETGLVKTNLMFHPDWELSSQEKYVYMYHHQQLPLLKENEVAINGIKLHQFDEGFVVVAFVRNTLPEAIRFEKMGVQVLDEDGTVLARKAFELDVFGEFLPYSCVPWRFLFENEDKLVDIIPDKGWSVAFEFKQPGSEKNHLDLDESWDNILPQGQKEQMRELVAGLPELRENEVTIVGLDAGQDPGGNLVTSILIRNGSQQDLKFEQLPIVVEDAEGQIVCRGNFQLNGLTVKGNTSKPWTFVFQKESLLIENPNLSKWKAYLPQES